MVDIRTLHHLGRRIALRPVDPDPLGPTRPAGVSRGRAGPGAVRRAPGSADLRIDGAGVWPTAVPVGQTVTLSARVVGRGLAFLMVEAWLLAEDAAIAFGPVFAEHVRAPDERRVGGVVRPVWDENVQVAAPVRAAFPMLTVGEDAALVAPAPERYGAVERRIAGRYTVAGGRTYDAQLVVDGAGAMTRLLRRPAAGGPGALRPGAPMPGDTFAPEIGVLVRGPDGAWSEGRWRAEALTLTGDPVHLQAFDPPPGRYLAALAVHDLDGAIARHVVEFGIEAT